MREKLRMTGLCDLFRQLVVGMLLVFAASATLAQGPIAKAPSHQAAPAPAQPPWLPAKLGAPALRDPIWVYNDWSSYDELSDNIPLTETLAMRELNEMVRLKKLG